MTQPARIRRPRHRSFDGLVRDRLDHTMANLTVGIDRREPFGDQFEFTAVPASDNIVISNQDLLVVDATDPPRVVLLGDDLPDPLLEGVIYFIGSEAAADTYHIYTTTADAVAGTGQVDITDAGTGTHVMVFLDPVETE